jgi:hypothetical protein
LPTGDAGFLNLEGKQKGRSPVEDPGANIQAEDVLLGGEVQLARDLYTVLDGPSNRTAILVHFDHALYGLAILLLSGEMESLLDPLEHEHFIFRLYLSNRVSVEALPVKGNLTRCQRAGEGAEQSAARCCDQVIESARVRLLLVERDAIVLGDLAMNAEGDRLFLRRNVRQPNLALNRLELDSRDVGYVSHLCSFCQFVPNQALP